MLQGGGSVVASPTLTHRRLLSEKISYSYEINDESCGFTINHRNNSFSLACQSNEKTLSFLLSSTSQKVSAWQKADQEIVPL